MSPRAAVKPERMLTVAEAAEQLGVDKSAVYHWIRSGHIASVQYPSRGASRGARRVRQSVIDKFLADCEHA